MARGASPRAERAAAAAAPAGGAARYVLLRGALGRGVPMALAVVLLLELFEGRPLGAARLVEPAFLGRLALALGVFAAGGALSAWARWKAMESRLRARGGPGRPGPPPG